MSEKEIDKLAVFNGSPLINETLHVGRPNIGNRERFFARINDMLDRHWLTNNGPFVLELEEKLTALLGVKHCIVMTNATIALEICARALGLQGEVVVPSFTFIATAHALQWQGITPVFCDVDPLTHNIDPAKIENLITPRTTGILGVHVWGRASDVEALSAIAHKHHISLMFDAAHAFSCSHQNQMVGGFGEAEVFSFHATKFFNSFEGGAITTNNADLAKIIRQMHNFGFSGMDSVTSIGINGKMSEVSAAMGLTSLESLDEFIQVNHRNYRAYALGLGGIPGLTLIRFDENEKNNYQYIVIEIDDLITRVSRDQIFKILHAENVRARRYFFPGCHQMEPYRSYSPNAGLLLPETEKLTRKVLQLPTGTAVTETDIEKICALLRFIVANGNDIRNRLADQTQED